MFGELQTKGFREVTGAVTWKSPSNIALVKYWGKHGRQLPANPSLSFSLSACHTTTRLAYRPKSETGISSSFSFEGVENPAFAARVERHLQELLSDFPLLHHFHLDFESTNSFPHSSGIASSASSMSALMLCLLGLYNAAAEKPLDDATFFRTASILSRLASGSACRSVYGGFTVWGESTYFAGSSDVYAIPLTAGVHADFLGLHDDVLIIEAGVKSVSSSAGHGLMKNHPFANARFEQAGKNMGILKSALEAGDIAAFGELIELEAMSLHAMMLTSTPSFVLFKPNTLAVIERIRAIRREKSWPIYFTLDAGANVHVIYPASISAQAANFIRAELLVYCEKGQYICDRIGNGPEKKQG